jgi:glycosyltransferase involved in cell wall biosynthesis
MSGKGSKIQFSVITPVYNRPDELDELLLSLSKQTVTGFEVVIVEDGSSQKSNKVVEKYQSTLDIKYFFKENTGPGKSRNYGCERASGNYFLFFDSDCIIPSDYFAIITNFLNNEYYDCFGGPDAAHESFNALQKAISYSMTAFLTTGGIRGSSEKVEKFNPRSFNMGFSKEVFQKTGGFPTIRFAKAKACGEDLDLSLQISNLGFRTILIKEAFVYHKRRTNLKQFKNQVMNFGFARITISDRHPGTLKLLHFAPAVFLLGCLGLLLLAIFVSPHFLWPVAIHAILIMIDASLKNKSLYIGLLAVATSYIQLFGYGFGFLKAVLYRKILKNGKF